MYVDVNPAGSNRYSSSQTTVPQLTRDNGGMLLMLDAVLVDGFGEKTPVSTTLSGSLVTFDFGVTHGFLERQIVRVSGASDVSLNGDHRISTLTGSTITLDIVGVISTDGDIEVKVAPLGWESVLGKDDPLVRAYKSTDPTSSGHVLHLDMSYPDPAHYHATAPVVRAMLSIYDSSTGGVLGNDISEASNAKSSRPNGTFFWYQKRGLSHLDAVGAGNTSWDIVGNSKFFYFLCSWSTKSTRYDNFNTRNAADLYCFGDYVKLGEDGLNPLMFKCSIVSNDNSTTLSAGAGTDSKFSQQYGSLFRHYDSGALTSTRQSSYFYLNNTSGTSGPASHLATPYPNDAGNAIFTMPVRLYDASYKVRGMLPSMMYVDSGTNGMLYNVVSDDCLFLTLQENNGDYLKPNNVAFYIGD